MSKPILKYRDTGDTIYDMMEEILVECPRCQSCARITPDPAEEKRRDYFAARRLTCSGCSLIRQWDGNSLGYDWDADPMRDSYFGLPLWLQTSCCGHNLWAYNSRHLSLIEQYIGADLREHRPDPEYGWQNISLVNRLPEWMLLARHREAVLNAIAKLRREKLPVT
jgi:hypothetical protein